MHPILCQSYCEGHPCSVVKEQQGAAPSFRVSTPTSALQSFHLLCQKHILQPPLSWVFSAERRHSSLLGHVWAWVTENIGWSRSVECGSEGAQCLCMYIKGVVRAPPSMLTHQQAHFQVAAPHNQGKYDLQLKSKGECLKGCGFRIYMRCKSKSSFILLALSHFLADTMCNWYYS